MGSTAAVPDGADDLRVRLDVDYPDRPLNRLTTLLRPLVALPVLVVLWLVDGSGVTADDQRMAISGGGLLVLPTAVMLVFRRRYPRWWFDFNRELVRFGARIAAYLALLDDRYPSTEDEQAVHLDIDYPDARTELNRWLPLVKWLLAVPHYVVLAFLWLAVLFVVLYAWVAILVTGRYPRGAFDFVVGVGRWHLRVLGYVGLLVTDRYPPFRLR